jgi:hypothetical protein
VALAVLHRGRVEVDERRQAIACLIRDAGHHDPRIAVADQHHAPQIFVLEQVDDVRDVGVEIDLRAR